MVYLTAAALRGVPSKNVRPFSISSDQVTPSSATFSEVTRSGWGVMSGVIRYSLRYRWWLTFGWMPAESTGSKLGASVGTATVRTFPPAAFAMAGAAAGLAASAGLAAAGASVGFGAAAGT